MANPNFDKDKAACILMDAATIGDAATCDKWGISRATLHRYRVRLSSDRQLQQVVTQKKSLQDKAWADEIPAAIASCINFLKEASRECNRNDPDAVHAIAGALKIMSEVSMTREVIDARLSGED